MGWENLTRQEGELTEVHLIEVQVHPSSKIGLVLGLTNEPFPGLLNLVYFDRLSDLWHRDSSVNEDDLIAFGPEEL